MTPAAQHVRQPGANFDRFAQPVGVVEEPGLFRSRLRPVPLERVDLSVLGQVGDEELSGDKGGVRYVQRIENVGSTGR